MSSFPVTASRVCERDPSALENVGAPEGKLEIVAICKGGPKPIFDFFAHCILTTVVNISELSFLALCSQKRFLYQMSTTRLLFPKPIRPVFLERGCRERLQNARAFLPKIISYR